MNELENNLSLNELAVTCITSNDNKFHLDSDGNLTVNRLITTQGTIDTEVNYDKVYPVGSIYMNDSSVDPSTLFGGTWELIRTFHGGELLGFATIMSGSSNGTSVSKDEFCTFSDQRISNKKYDVTNYVSDVLTGTSGAIYVKPKGIVGLVEAQMYVSGFGSDGIIGLWWGGNGNPLPEGVSLLPTNGNNGLLTGPLNQSYGGHSNTYFYKVEETALDDGFFVNPGFYPYAGSFTPCMGGVASYLFVKAYAKTGTTNMWKRKA